MELLKLGERPVVEYAWKDVTFQIRKDVSVNDKFTLDTEGSWVGGGTGTAKMSAWQFYRSVIRMFVTGWKGVTENGKEVPWDYETFLSRLPGGGPGDDLIMKLGVFIIKELGLLNTDAKESDPKND